MQFDDETPGQKSETQSGQEVVRLKREVPLMERQRNALFAGVVSLAGVALGFGLGQFASANSNCPQTVIVHTSPQAAPASTASCAPASDMITWLGVVVETQPGVSGAFIKNVFAGSPAEAAGLEAGQLIVSLGNAPVRGARELIHEVRSHHAGERLTIRVNSFSGQREARTVVLGELSTAELHHMRPRLR